MTDDADGQKKVPSVYARLAARFPASAHKTKTIGGSGLTYVDGETVISRLNEELGLDGWSFEVKAVTVLEDEVWAQGRLTVYLGDRMIVREQAGGQIINRKRGIPAMPARPAQDADGDRPAIPAVAAQPAVKGEPIEVSNDIKGAITDCLKKCATLAGVGLYLYDPNERREIEAEMKGRAGPNPTTRPAASTNAAAATSQASRSASTPTTSPAAPSSSSTTATPAQPRTAREALATSSDVQAAAVLTGANPPTPIDPARRKLVEAYEKGRTYAKSIGMDLQTLDVPALSNDELSETVEALRSQCQFVLRERKKKAAAAS